MVKQLPPILALLLFWHSSVYAEEISLKSGDYLEDGFIQILKSTRSPVAALKADGHLPQSINVSRSEDDLLFAANDNWHEGYGLFTLHKNGEMEVGEQQLNYPQPKIDSPRHFWFRESKQNKWRGYTYVGNADTEIMRIALVGKYTDEKEQNYEFSTHGIVRGLGPDTQFSLNNDHIGNCDFDYFILNDTIIAFKHEHEELYLYSVKPPATAPDCDGSPDYSNPLHILKKVQD